MNSKNSGFTLVELLAVLVLLSVVVGIVFVSVNGGFSKAKAGSEEVFIKTLEDAMDMYVSDPSNINIAFDKSACATFSKSNHSASLYKTVNDVPFDVIMKVTKSLDDSDLVNPAIDTKSSSRYCSKPLVSIYRDSDGVYYYKVQRSAFGCLTNDTSKYITNLRDNVSC